MLTLKRASSSRICLCPVFHLYRSLSSTESAAAAASSTSRSQSLFSSLCPPFLPSSDSPPFTSSRSAHSEAGDAVIPFKAWFKSGRNPLLDRIFEILKARNNEDLSSIRDADLALSQLGLHLSEPLVLQVLNYGDDVLSCLKFFDWSGRQPGFYHTRATFLAIFKVLSRSRHMSFLQEFLDTFAQHKYKYNARFHDTLVIGYAVAGKPEFAVELLGKMRFQGLDLDYVAYNVLLNALVEDHSFDFAQIILDQIKFRGYENVTTQSIMVKSYCKQNRFHEAEDYIRGLLSAGQEVSGPSLRVLVDALCRNSRFEEAGNLVDEFRELGGFQMDQAYGVWIRHLVQSGKSDIALEFLRDRQADEGYIPDVFRYNLLICRLLKENRLEEVFDLLMEMKDLQVVPDKVTMNAALCFFCKAGMVDVALELYNLSSELGLTLNSMMYNYLINTLSGDGNVDDAFRVLKNSVEKGHCPGKKTFSILADAYFRAGQLDKMGRLVSFALNHNLIPDASICNKCISYFCRAGRVRDGYSMYEQLNQLDKVTSRYTYLDLIHGYNQLNRGEMSAQLLVKMQEGGHSVTRKLIKSVVTCLFNLDNPERRFFTLVEELLLHREPDCYIYNSFIDAAGHVGRPDVARQVFEMMARSGIASNLDSDILLLQSYLKFGRISDALTFFEEIRARRKVRRKLFHCIITGLCKANKPELALKMYREIIKNGLVPSLQCYEELILLFCSDAQYDVAVQLFNEMEKYGRFISSFIGNVFLMHSMKSRDFYAAWVRSRDFSYLKQSSMMLGELIAVFSGQNRAEPQADSLENVIRQCFPLDVFTYNMLMKRLSIDRIDEAVKLLSRMCRKGFEPNQWTFDTLVLGLFRHGRKTQAMQCLTMYKRRYNPSERVLALY